MEKNNLSTNQEIDLIYLFKKIKSMFNSFGYFIFKSIRFFIKNKYIIISLIIFGVVLGELIEKTLKNSFKNEIIVIPNFDSSEYLYSMIDNYKNLETKNDKEKIYLNNIIDIEIKPIVNINSYINNTKNREFFKTITESGIKFEDFFKNEDIQKTSKEFLITINTRNQNISKKSVNYILDKLNNSNYYLEKSKIEIKNLEKSKIQLNQSINQINLIINNFGENNLAESKSQLNINTYENLGDIINLKNQYLNELLIIDSKLITSSKIIYPTNVSYNNHFREKFYYNTKLVYPIILVFIFLILNIFKKFYNKYNRLELQK